MNSLARPRAEEAGPALFDGVDLVLFDFDGVVADSEVISLTTLARALAAYGIEMTVEEVRGAFLGTSLGSIRAHISEVRPGRDTSGFGALWQSELFAQFETSLKPCDAIGEVTEHLTHRDIPYCIASSGTMDRIHRALAIMGLSDRFPHIFSAEQVARGKPAPDLFCLASRELAMAPERCLVIEDSPFGISAAKAAGMRALGYVGGSHLVGIRSGHADGLRREGAEAIIESFAEVTR